MFSHVLFLGFQAKITITLLQSVEQGGMIQHFLKFSITGILLLIRYIFFENLLQRTFVKKKILNKNFQGPKLANLFLTLSNKKFSLKFLFIFSSQYKTSKNTCSPGVGLKKKTFSCCPFQGKRPCARQVKKQHKIRRFTAV